MWILSHISYSVITLRRNRFMASMQNRDVYRFRFVCLGTRGPKSVSVDLSMSCLLLSSLMTVCLETFIAIKVNTGKNTRK